MIIRFLALTLVCIAVPAVVSAQSIEIVFTPAVTQQALALKGALKVDKVDAFNALALVGASPERRKAYADKVAGGTAVVIIGEDAMKAAAAVTFSVPVIVVNASGATAATSRVIRVFDSTSDLAGRATAATAATAKDLIGGANPALKGDVGTLVQAVLMALK